MSTPQTTADREPAKMSVRHAAVWAMGGQYLSFAIQFATSVIISRYFMKPADVGLFSVALSAAMVAAVLQDFGLARYISGLPAIDGDAIARCSTMALLFSFVVAGIIAASAWPMAHTYHQAELLPIMLIIAASYLFLPFMVVPSALMSRQMNFRGLFVVGVGGALTQGAVGLGLGALGYKSFALAWATLACAAARGGLAQMLRPALPWPLRFDQVRPIVHAGARLTSLYGLGALGTRTPDMVVGKLISLLGAGLYSRANSLSDQFRMLISGAIGSVFYPAFARIRDRGEAPGPAYLRVVAGYTAVIWPGMAGLALVARPIVHALYGEGWMGVAPLLSTIALTEIFLVSLPLHTDLPILFGRLNRLLVLNAADTALSVALLAAGCRWGLEGAAASRVVYGAGWVLIYARFLYEIVGFDRQALFAIYAKSAVATLAALAPIGAIYAFWLGPDAVGFGVLIPAVLAGVGLWGLALWGLRHPALDDLAGIAAQVAAPLWRRLARRAV